MGVVYAAEDTVLGRMVALKCLHPSFCGDREVRRRFSREARVLRSWSHPNVVSTYDFLEHEHLLAIVMEYVEGHTLTRHIETWRGRVPFGDIREIFTGVLEAMEAAHGQGIIHRDLKPDNVLVRNTPDGIRPKIVDFGIAKILDATTYTMSGAFLGTCRYMSPEQVKSPQAADPRSDVYSLGVSLYQAVTGKVPFDAPNHFAMMMAHVNEQAPRPSTLREDVPPELERLVLDALAKEPRARPGSCADFLARLEQALAAFDTTTASARLSTRPPPASIQDTRGNVMVLVPGGAFSMGAPRRSVSLDSFYIDKLTVTNGQYARFLEATGYRPTDPGAARFLAHWRGGKVPRDLEQHPVVNVSWDDARAYAAWAGKRLPTEAEWEKAARGVDGRPFPWGKEKPSASLARYGGGKRGPSPVGSHPLGASPYGALDMAGNVWEWCEDADDPGFYADGPERDPCNVPHEGDGGRRVMRGGCWMYGARSLRTYARTSFDRETRFEGGGFRCVRGVG
jgi:formylglycine-generating enzyme required for sulfatase activity